MRKVRQNFPRSADVVRAIGLWCLLISISGCCRTSGWVMNNSGMGYYQKGNYSMARGEFERAVIDSPRDPDYRHNLAMAMVKQGDTQSAEQVLRHNLTVGPMHQPTYHALTQILVSQQRTAEADQLLTEWRDTQPYLPETYVEQAWLQREMGNKAAAEQSLQQALQIKPNHPAALAQLGQLYHETGQADQAASYYQRSLQARWGQPEVRSRLATVTGSSSTNLNRSALMQNSVPVSLASMNQMPMAAGQPMIVQNVGMVSGDAIAIDDPSPRRHRHRHHRHGATEQVTAYPLPSYGMADAGAMQSGFVTATMPIDQQPTIISSPMMAPQLAGQPIMSPPQIATSPTPISQADPAHATEMTAAGLPIVEPH
jgi:Tfp pilus assembly protein PilF